MQEQDIIPRIHALCQARSWTVYRLAKESGIPYSTLCTMLHKANAPSIPTVIKLCQGFGISLSEFFDMDNDSPCYTQEQRQILCQWDKLTEENKAASAKYIQYLLDQQS